MIGALISSKTRIKLLLKFFLNSSTKSYLRSLSSEFGESTNSIRLELNRLEEAGMLVSKLQGNRKVFQANSKHPLFGEVHNILLKHIGLDKVIETVIERLGNVKRVYLVGEFAKGMDSKIIDLIFIGDVDKAYLMKLIEKAEDIINRKIRYIIYSEHEFEGVDENTPSLVLWSE